MRSQTPPPACAGAGAVAMKRANEAGQPAKESAERRAGAEGNADQRSTHRTQIRARVTQALDRVRQALLHHVNPDTLRTAFYALKRKAAPGADRKSRRDRVRAKLKEIKEELRRRMHGPVREQAEWLKQAVAGFFQYHAVPTNGRALAAFRYHVIDHWRRTLRRRGQKHPMTWARIGKLADDWLPKPRILHPLAKPALRRQTPKVGAVCGKAARTVLCGGRSVMSVPTAIRNRPE